MEMSHEGGTASVHNTISFMCRNKYAWCGINIPNLFTQDNWFFAQLLFGRLQVTGRRKDDLR